MGPQGGLDVAAAWYASECVTCRLAVCTHATLARTSMSAPVPATKPLFGHPRRGFLLAALATAIVAPAHAVDAIAVDFAKPTGRIRALHGVCNGPVAWGENPDLRPWFR